MISILGHAYFLGLWGWFPASRRKGSIAMAVGTSVNPTHQRAACSRRRLFIEHAFMLAIPMQFLLGQLVSCSWFRDRLRVMESPSHSFAKCPTSAISALVGSEVTTIESAASWAVMACSFSFMDQVVQYTLHFGVAFTNYPSSSPSNCPFAFNIAYLLRLKWVLDWKDLWWRTWRFRSRSRSQKKSLEPKFERSECQDC